MKVTYYLIRIIIPEATVMVGGNYLSVYDLTKA